MKIAIATFYESICYTVLKFKRIIFYNSILEESYFPFLYFNALIYNRNNAATTSLNLIRCYKYQPVKFLRWEHQMINIKVLTSQSTLMVALNYTTNINQSDCKKHLTGV